MVASPGGKDYGALSLAVQYRAKPVVVAIVPPECFLPRPGVDSAVIRLEVYDTPPVAVSRPDYMFKLIRASFNQRRKTLANGLSGDPSLNLSRDQVQQALERMGLSALVRGETLSLEQFARLAEELGES